MDVNLPSGTVTFLFSDIEDSTTLWEQDPEAMRIALVKHDRILSEAIAANHGQLIKTTGDGVFAVFPTALDGILAAAAMQSGLLLTNENLQLRIRIGIHTGEAELREGDYHGQSTNRAARIMSAGHGGQVLLSGTTMQIVREHLPKDWSLRELGEHTLKGLTRPEPITQLVLPNLPQDFPELKSSSTRRDNLPVQLTSFIGREKEITEIKALLESARLVTLTGSGGTGKSRLSIEIGQQVLTQFAGGVWLVELAPLTEASQINPALALVLGVQESAFSPLEALLADYLCGKSLLLLLDNCEHLIAACARLAEVFLHQCPQLKILASSREALGIGGETAYHIPSLAESESSQLFVERALAVNPEFSLTAANAAQVAQICSRLDGIPLAIELAAARTKLLSAEQIASRLDDRFKLLTGGSRTALPRQQTLRALIDWSYDMLNETEAAFLRRLSVFRGGWNLEAAEFIFPQGEVLDLLAQLVNKSLVVVDENESASRRFHLLESLRQYAHDKLMDAGEARDVNRLHASFFLQMAEAARTQLNQADSSIVADKLESERENYRAAIEWTMEEEIESALRIVYSLEFFWLRNGNEAQGRNLTEAVIAKAESLPPLEGAAGVQRKLLIARAVSSQMTVAISLGDNLYFDEISAKSEFYARELGDKVLLARTLAQRCLGNLAVGKLEGVETWSQEALQVALDSQDAYALGLSLGVNSAYFTLSGKDPEIARAYASRANKLLLENGYLWMNAISWLINALAAKYKGNYDLAQNYFEDILPLFEEMGDILRVTMIQTELGHIERYRSNLEEAEQAYRQSLPVWQKLGHRAAVANLLEILAFIAASYGNKERALRLLGAAEVLREQINIPMTQFEQVEYDKQVADLHTTMDEQVFMKLWSEGRLFTLDQAVQFALA